MYLKQYLVRLGSAITLTSSFCGIVHAETDKPNILFINCDDLGVRNVGFNGDERFSTPNLDRLSKEGIIFTDAYSAAANCAPSRACMLTGQTGARHGIFTVGGSSRGNSIFQKLIPIKNNETVPLENILISEAIKEAGYTTIHLGKWHINNSPEEQGFDISIGGEHGAKEVGGYYGPFEKQLEKYNKNYDDASKQHLSALFVDEAIKLLNDATIRPFYMHLDFHLIHTPLHRVNEFAKTSTGKENSNYASMISKVDKEAARIIVALKDAGIAENTLVIFTSDNGAKAVYATQKPYRGGKGTYYEGGIRVPFFALWPGKIPSDTKCNVPIINLDMYPTFLAVAGIEAPEGKTLDGVNILPLLTQSGPIAERPLYWYFPIYLPANGPSKETTDPLFRTRPGSVIRSGNWKLHRYFEDGHLELYNLNDDIGERHNLADEMPEKAQELLTQLNKWLAEVEAEIPSEKNPKYDADAETEALQNAFSGHKQKKKRKNEQRKKTTKERAGTPRGDPAV